MDTTPRVAGWVAVTSPQDEARSRWRGQPGRLEVWYSTLTDASTGTGVWLHHELVAPTDGRAAFGHGWIAVFEPGSTPVLRRFGTAPWTEPVVGFACRDVRADGQRLTGEAGDVSWSLAVAGEPRTLHTFPRWAWRHEVLPAAQVVPRPSALYSGTVHVGGRELVLDEASGADARIYGHGNAKRWGWLHADLGGGDVCEVVTAVSMRPGLDRVPPLALVRFRLGGRDLPGDPLLTAPALRTRLRRDGFDVRGWVGRRRLRMEVHLPGSGTVDVDYQDPDGARLRCRNSLLASAHIRLEGRGRRDVWSLDGTAHAEVGGFRGHERP